MKIKHPQADLIHAWADGKELQLLDVSTKTWLKVMNPNWGSHDTYRIKPEADKMEDYSIYINAYARFEYERQKHPTFRHQPIFLADVRLTWDGSTGKLKNIQILEKD
jgi:hypothetical protein